jgi:hypothetical protein
MIRKLPLVFMGIALCSAVALSQTRSSTQAATTASGPVAWVYVSGYVGTTNETQVYGFAAAPNGKLTAIPGSPFPAELSSMAVNGLYLFGAPSDGSYINTYRIESDGALSYAATTNASTPNKCTNTPGPVFLDHTGATLYDFYYWGDSECANNVYQAWSIVKSSGDLSFSSATTPGTEEFTNVLTFIGSNQFAYTSDCYHFDPQISGFQRSSNGSLTELDLTQTAPSGSFGCPYLAAADPTNHLAIPWQPYPTEYSSPSGPYQLATYTVQSNGDIKTGSTYANMPKVAVGNINALAMSPSGKLLAVAGTSGLQVFHFNGADPITDFTGLMSTQDMNQIFWDNDNHLYAISSSGNRLAVFAVTPTSWTWIDTYSVNSPVGLIVQPLPVP